MCHGKIVTCQGYDDWLNRFLCFQFLLLIFPLSLKRQNIYIPTDIGLIVMNSIGKNKLYTHSHTHKNIDRYPVSCFQRPSVNKRTENILYNLAFHDNFSAIILWPVAVKAKRSPLPFVQENQFEHFLSIIKSMLKLIENEIVYLNKSHLVFSFRLKCFALIG